MDKLKVLVIGSGSIGCRHIENLLSLGIEVSAFRYRSELRKELSQRYNIKVFELFEEAINSKPDAAVIANRTDQHIDVAIAAAKKGLHLFIEKPLSHNLIRLDELASIIHDKKLIVEIGCMMRFHPNLKFIKQLLEEEAIGIPYFVRACVGQFLPDWRSEQDYRQSYSAKSAHGGGVLFDLIHEIDYLYWLFGSVREVSSFLDHISDLEIETEDIAQILLRFKNNLVAQIEMDYLSPFYRRECEIVGNKGLILWNYSTGEVILKILEQPKAKVFRQPETFERNTMFIDHMKYFIETIQNRGKPMVSFEESIDVLKIALAAHKSSKEHIHIKPEDMRE